MPSTPFEDKKRIAYRGLHVLFQCKYSQELTVVYFSIALLNYIRNETEAIKITKVSKYPANHNSYINVQITSYMYLEVVTLVYVISE